MLRPATPAQQAACQKNAQHSTGPRTAAGKTKTRLNAVTHGLTAKLPVLPFEDEADFEALRDGFETDFAPQNTYQKFLTHQLATQAWRILRSQQVEIGLQELLLKQVIHDLEAKGHRTAKALTENPYAGLALTLQPNDRHNHLHQNLFRYLRDIQSAFHRTRQALADSQKPAKSTIAKPPAQQSNQTKSTTPRSVSSPSLPQSRENQNDGASTPIPRRPQAI